MLDSNDFLYGLDTLIQYIAEKDKAAEIHFQIIEKNFENKNDINEKIIKNIEKLGFKWNSMINDINNDSYKEIYKIKFLPEINEEYSKKKGITTSYYIVLKAQNLKSQVKQITVQSKTISTEVQVLDDQNQNEKGNYIDYFYEFRVDFYFDIFTSFKILFEMLKLYSKKVIFNQDYLNEIYEKIMLKNGI